MRAPSRISRDSDGFTLIEVLVALTIFGLAFAPLLAIFSQGLDRARDLRDNAAARALAQSLIAETGAETPMAVGDADGSYGVFSWRLHVAPYEGDGSGAVRLAKLTASVTWKDGNRSLSLTTLRALSPDESPQ